jgi:hypothetical protein
MRRLLTLSALLVLLIGGLPAHAQEADTSATDTTMTDPSVSDPSAADTTAGEPMTADTSETTARADSAQADTTQTVTADSVDIAETDDSARDVADTAAATSPEERARATAESWLALIDAGEFGERWEAAAPSLQQGLTREQWVARGTRARQQLQALQSREHRSTQYRDSTAQLPGGPVAILQYKSEFDGGSTLEAVVTTQQDSTWRVAGYRVVPAPDSMAVSDTTQVPSDTTDASETTPE